MKKMFMKKLAVVAMAAAVVFTTVAPVISNPTTIEAATKKATKLKKARFKSSAISLNEGGNVIWVSGVKLSAKKNVTLYLNDKKTTIKKISTWKDGEWVSQIYLKSALKTGTYKIKIQEKGYKAVSKTLKYESIAYKFVVWDPDTFINEDDGKLVVYVALNPSLEGKEVVFTIDGNNAEVINSFVNGDGVFINWLSAEGLAAGEHTITVTAEGFDTYTGTVEIK